MNSLIRIASVLLCLIFAACGGGGGGGGGGNNSPATSLTLDRSTLTFVTDSTVNTPAPQSVTATFVGDGLVVGTLPGQVLPPWLFVGTPAQTASPVSVPVSIIGAQLAPGRYSTTLRFVTGRADGTDVVVRDITVTYTIDHVLSPPSVQLAHVAGVATGPSVTATVTTQGATWQATSNAPWLTVTPASGTGSAQLNITTNPGALLLGSYSGTITVTDTLTNRSRTTTVNLGVDPRRLQAFDRGVALTSTLGATVLSRTVQIIDNGGLATHWVATDDAPWLELSATSGVTSSELTLTANDSGLADGLYFATVTTSPDNEPTVANDAVVKVGLYVDHTSAAPVDPVVSDNIEGTPDVVVDPIRPYIYSSHWFNEATMTIDGSVMVHNIYTGALVDTIPVPGRQLDKLAISPDGAQLVVVNSTDNSIIPIALSGDARMVGAEWTGMRLANGTANLAYTQVNGTDVLVSGERQILSTATGTVLTEVQGLDSLFALFRGRVVAAPNGSAAYLMSESGGNHRIARIALGNRGGVFSAVASHDFNEAGDALDLAVDRKSGRLYTLSNNFPVPDDSLREYNAATMALTSHRATGIGTSGSLDIAPNGDVYVTNFAGTFKRYDAVLTEIGHRDFDFSLGPIYQGHVSSDGQRAFVLGNSGMELRYHIFDAALQ